MRVFLVQHGEAKSEEEDASKHLTENGSLGAKKLGQRLFECGIRPSQIWHSGKTRSQQTASIIASCYSDPIEIIEKYGMAPKDHHRPISEALQDGVMIVGHLPFLGKMAADLLTGHEKSGVISFSYGSCLCLIKEGKHWAVAWMLDPSVL